MLKGLNMLTILPLLSFFIPSFFAYGLGIIPVFWAYQAVAATSQALFYLHLAGGLVVGAGWFAYFYNRFMRLYSR